MAALQLRPILVTGANKGIGKAICLKLLSDYNDVFVLLGSRNLERGRHAIDDIVQEIGSSARERVECVVLDTASDESVQAAVPQIATILTRVLPQPSPFLYGICNNAGVWTKDANEMLQVNYYGPQRVNQILGQRFLQPQSRIVNVSSGAAPGFVEHHCRDASFQRVLTEPWTAGGLEPFNSMVQAYFDTHHATNKDPEVVKRVYGFTKACLNTYTWLFSRQQPNWIVNAVTPGFIDTDLTAGGGASNPPSAGAVVPVYLLMDPTVLEMPTGRYYGSDGKRSPWHFYRAPHSPEYNGPDGPNE